MVGRTRGGIGDRRGGGGARALAIAFVLATLAASPALHAQAWGGSVGIASDNVYRGVSLSDDDPAWFADLHREIGGDWIVGVGADATRSHDATPDAQLTLYLDRNWRLADDWSGTLGAVHYEWPWNARRASLRYDEVNASIGYAGRWRAQLAVSPDAGGAYRDGGDHHGVAAWLETSWHQPLAGRLAADVGIGYAHVHYLDQDGYPYGNLSLAYGIGDVYLSLGLLHTVSVRTLYYYGRLYSAQRTSDDRVVASAQWAF